MRVHPDILRSLDTGRLCVKKLDLNQKVNVGFYIILASLFIGIGLILPTLFLLQAINDNKLNASSFILLGLFFAVGFITLYGIANDNKFTRIKGKNLETNKIVMLTVLKEKYNSELISEGDLMLSYYKRGNALNFALRIIVLFDRNHVLINISRFNQIGIKSFFHPAFSKRTINSIAKAFTAKLQ